MGEVVNKCNGTLDYVIGMSTRLTFVNRYRIGDSGDPCGKPGYLISISSEQK